MKTVYPPINTVWGGGGGGGGGWWYNKLNLLIRLLKGHPLQKLYFNNPQTHTLSVLLNHKEAH